MRFTIPAAAKECKRLSVLTDETAIDRSGGAVSDSADHDSAFGIGNHSVDVIRDRVSKRGQGLVEATGAGSTLQVLAHSPEVDEARTDGPGLIYW
jgi:hypothetical protein